VEDDAANAEHTAQPAAEIAADDHGLRRHAGGIDWLSRMTVRFVVDGAVWLFGVGSRLAGLSGRAPPSWTLPLAGSDSRDASIVSIPGQKSNTSAGGIPLRSASNAIALGGSQDPTLRTEVSV
jgi:hypothetical protein